MNEFFQLAAKIAYDNKLSRYYGLEAKVAGEKWDKIKGAASKAWNATKSGVGKAARNSHVQKGVASAAVGTTAGIVGKAKGMSGKGALGLGAGVAAGTEAGLYGGEYLFKKTKELLEKKRAKNFRDAGEKSLGYDPNPKPGEATSGDPSDSDSTTRQALKDYGYTN